MAYQTYFTLIGGVYQKNNILFEDEFGEHSYQYVCKHIVGGVTFHNLRGLKVKTGFYLS